MIKTVIKRDGTKETFNGDKIKAAISAAMDEVEGSTVLAEELTGIVETRLGGESAGIETIQDVVEEVLMERAPTTARAFILYREERSRVRAARLHPDPNALGEYIHRAKYAKWLKDSCRREFYGETVARSLLMHIARYPEFAEVLRWAFRFVDQRKVLTSMRSFQFGGFPIEKHNARMFNCSFTHIDRIAAFSEGLYLLLCGCGVGYSVQKRHTEQLPKVRRIDRRHVKHYHVDDTIEGWGDALYAILHAYMVSTNYVEFDFSKIRSEGSPLVTSGGRAPGHLPLKAALERVRLILDGAVDRHLRPIEVHDIMCHAAEAVLAGGIRRSSLICLFDRDDEEMLTAKTADNFSFTGLNSHRAMANNSVVLPRDQVHRAEFFGLLEHVKFCGEPGFYFTHNPDYGCNPCGEIGLYPKIDGETGFAFCNLCEINLAAINSESEFMECVEAAAIIGTFQATFNDFPYLSDASSRIAERDRLLGIGMTGMQDNPTLAFDYDLQKRGARRARVINEDWADKLAINPAARLTCIKPSGTASLELGGVASGIHPHHARRYFRRVTANPNEAVAQFFKEHNPHMVEEKPNGDWCITFCVEAPLGAATLKRYRWPDFLHQVIETYRNWVVHGTNERSMQISPGLTHNVSCTVIVPDKAWENVWENVWVHRNHIGAMTFLGEHSDKGIPFMPREAVATEDEPMWQSLIRHYKPVPYGRMVEEADGVNRSLEPACIGGQCDK